MKLEHINKENGEWLKKWDDFVNHSPQGSVFSLSSYLNALEVNYKILCAVDKKSNEIYAGIVLAKNQINTYSNPMLDKYLGVLFKEEASSHKQKSRQYKAMELLADELKKYKTFDYYFHPAFKNWIPFYWQGFSQQTRYTYQINLNNSIKAIEKKFHGNLRNDIKNALNYQVDIRKEIEFEQFYEIINKTFLRQGSKAPFTKNKLRGFIHVLTEKNRIIIFGAYTINNELISACGIVFDNKTAYLILNGIDIERNIRGANALLILETIKHAKNQKLEIFDFEGSMLNGVEQFYRRFGAELTPYYRIWNDNLFNYTKTYAKKIYKKIRYGR